MNKKILVVTGFKKSVELISQNKCPICLTDINKESFENDVSYKESLISGLCQKCQDEVFGKD